MPVEQKVDLLHPGGTEAAQALSEIAAEQVRGVLVEPSLSRVVGAGEVHVRAERRFGLAVARRLITVVGGNREQKLENIAKQLRARLSPEPRSCSQLRAKTCT